MERNINFYSQRGEDQWLYEKGYIKPNGFYIDIGAAHPYTNSNTAFLDQLGWEGICVEPDPYDYRRRNCKVEKVAIHSYNGFCGFRYAGEIGKIDEDSPLTAACTTLKAIVDKNHVSKIDLMSIDTEGMEYEIFTVYACNVGMPLPKILIAEYNTLGKIDNRLRTWLKKYTNYKYIHRTDFNYIFCLQK